MKRYNAMATGLVLPFLLLFPGAEAADIPTLVAPSPWLKAETGLPVFGAVLLLSGGVWRLGCRRESPASRP